MSFFLALAQFAVKQAEPTANLATVEKLAAKAAAQGCDMICLPEMWTTGFDWQANTKLLSEQKTVVKAVAELAARHQLWIMGSMLDVAHNGRPLNNLIVFNPAGRIAATYAKTHLFTLFDEQNHMAAGDSLVTVEMPWGKMGLAVCYDLRFPELFRSYALSGVDLVFLPAAFPYPRLAHWQTLLKARAIENQCFMVAVNQCGDEVVNNSEISYFGSSSVIDPWGEIVVEAKEHADDLVVAEIDIEMVADVRTRIPVFRDRRPELYGNLGKDI